MPITSSRGANGKTRKYWHSLQMFTHVTIFTIYVDETRLLVN